MQLLQTWKYVSALILHIDIAIDIGMHVLDGQVSSCTYGGLPDVAIGSVIKEDGSHGVFVDAAQYICMLLPLYALHGCHSCLQKLAVKLRIIALEGIFWRRLFRLMYAVCICCRTCSAWRNH